MKGLGTIINVAAIIVAGIIGLLGGKLMKERFQESMQTVCGISVMFMSIAGAIEEMMTVNEDGSLSSGQGMLIVLCMVIGTLIGEIINFEGLFERFGEWLKKKSGSSGDHSFVAGFLTASYTVSIGAMAIIGAIDDGINGDYTILVSKSILDFIIIVVLTSTMGKGCIFSAIPVLLIQGSMTALAVLIEPVMTELALSYISLIGNILIFCVGVNLVWKKDIRVANMIPALICAVVAAFI